MLPLPGDVAGKGKVLGKGVGTRINKYQAMESGPYTEGRGKTEPN